MQDTQWIDRSEYPFQSRFFETPAGRLHYVDEGQGRPVVFVHGNPTWSFLFRHLIRGLSKNHRCIAPDLLGFGLADKPENWSYLPRDHAQTLKAFIKSLGLKDLTLVVHDFGGPIGLAYALERPENVKQLVLCNTWMWSVKGDPHFERSRKFSHGALGKFLHLRWNFAVRATMKRAGGSRLSDTALRHYESALPTPAARIGAWTLARERLGSSDWFAELARQKEKLADKPALILWGLKDAIIPKKIFQNWSLVFPGGQTRGFPDAGHYLMEEKSAELLPILADFLQKNG